MRARKNHHGASGYQSFRLVFLILLLLLTWLRRAVGAGGGQGLDLGQVGTQS